MLKILKNSGFTLVELAIVLVVLTLLLSSMLGPLGAQIQNRRIAETQKTLEEIKEALIGFAIINKRLPGPAASAINGIEVGQCNFHATCTGFVPWATLGINGVDAWGKRIRYSVTPDFTRVPPAVAITLTSTGTKRVNTRDNAGAIATQASDIPVVLVSFGAKNFGTSETGAAIANTSTTNIDEQNNSVEDDTFITRTITESTTAPGGEFDDIVIWLPKNIIINRITASGQTL